MLGSKNRREFLKATSAGVAAAAALTGASITASQGANDKLTVGLIGCGGRGTHDAQLFQSEVVGGRISPGRSTQGDPRPGRAAEQQLAQAAPRASSQGRIVLDQGRCQLRSPEGCQGVERRHLQSLVRRANQFEDSSRIRGLAQFAEQLSHPGAEFGLGGGIREQQPRP